MTTRLAAVLIFTALAGCMTPEERLANWQAWCDHYGFERGTDAFAQCVQSQAQEQRNREDAAWDRTLDNLSQPAPALSQPRYCYDQGYGVISCP